MSAPTLSVVLPNYNHAAELPRAIESILNQTRLPDEFLILDDASTDESVAVIRRYAEKSPLIRLIRNERNTGVMAAHRRLFEEAQGEWVHAIAADDWRTPRFFERAMEMAARFPQAGLIFGDTVVVDEADRELARIRVRCWPEPLFAPPERFLQEYLESEAPSHSSIAATIFRRDAFAQVGWYREELLSWGDTFALRAVGLAHGACYIPETFAHWRRRSGSYSGASRSEPERMLGIIERAARLMRSPEFGHLFPERHVRRWRRLYRLLVVRDFWKGDIGDDSPFLARWARRAGRTPAAVRLLFYRGREP